MSLIGDKECCLVHLRNDCNFSVDLYCARWCTGTCSRGVGVSMGSSKAGP